MRAETVIATHGNTDFDALASMLAARRLYPEGVVCLAGSLNRNVREFYRLHADELDAIEASRLELDAIRRLIVVETVDAARLDRLEEVARDPAVDKVVFDHHGERPDWAPADAVVLSDDAALTTTLVGILAERELTVTPLEATVFALGIHEDTGSLTFAEATIRDAEALAWCLRHGASQELVADYLHTPLSPDERELLAALMESTETHAVAGVEALLASATWRDADVSVSHLASKLVELTDARALVVLVAMGDRVFAVTRSRLPELDASALAAALGGGGHAQAASATFKGTLAEARSLLLEGIEPATREPIRAREVMASPPRVVGPDDTVGEAMRICQRHRMSGVLAVDGTGALVGVVSREDLDRAIGHGLSHAPVKGIMSGRVATCDEETPLPELQRLLAGSREGRVAVCRDDRVVGVVTRSDVLRALGTATAGAETVPGESLRAQLEALGPLQRVFEAVQAVGEHVDGVYLVGGTVRDILLGERGFDVDVAVEGDALALARALADELGGRSRPHDKFGTAVVVYGDGERVDVVTARTEFYDAPAALPTVEHATIREDLFRRDFTVNAMAVSLKGADYGRLVDPFGGRRDLEARAIRVLHNLSFVDDPTRIFRAIRYENRYGLRMEPHTERLARACVELGLVGDLSSARLRDELVALLEEGDVRHSLLRLADLGTDRAIHPHLAADEQAADLLARLVALRDRHGLDVPAWRLGLTVLARRMPPDEIYAWTARLKLRRRDAEAIAGAVTLGPRLAERLAAEALAPAEVVALAEPYAPDAPLYALALGDAPALHDYFARLADVRLAIGGRELAELGLGESPRVGEILGELRRRKLNGELDGRESELAAARELIGRQ
ncbi:MAG TPA: CBS domain-containing protein [Gaiellaceae bacterium]|nr:CBS domain-containing protein [Gaiellaceae bacterium]